MIKIIKQENNIISYNEHGENILSTASVLNTYEQVKKLYKQNKSKELLTLLNKHTLDKEIISHFKVYQQKDLDNARIYQRKVIELMKYFLNTYHQGMGIFLEQRTGKTPTISIFLEENKEKIKSNVFICNGGNRENIISQLEQFAPSFKIFKLYKKSSSLNAENRLKVFKEFADYQGYKIIVSTPKTLALDYNNPIFKKGGKKHHLIKDIDAFIIDEGHFINSSKSKQTKSIIGLRKRAKLGYILTGTPAVNNPSAFLNLLNFIKPKNQSIIKIEVLEYFYQRKKKSVDDFGYKKRIGYVSYDDFDQIKNDKKQEFANWLETFCVQAKYSEVIDWYKEPAKIKIELLMLPEQQKHYDKMLDTFKMETTDQSIKRAKTLIEQMIRLRQIAIDPSLINCSGKSNKTEFILNWVKQNPQKPLVIFSNFTSYLKKLKIALEQQTNSLVGMITGEQMASEKNQAQEDFQNKKTNIILCNLTAGSKGFTLDRANHKMFINRSWTPSENKQAAFRFMDTQDRGRKEKQEIIDIISKNSIEEYILKALNAKLSKTDIINNFKKYILEN